MSFIEYILDYFSDNTKPSVERTEVDAKFVGEAVNTYIRENAKNGSRLPMDGKYYTATKENMQKIVDADDTNTRAYKKATYDCENFAFSFMAAAQREYGITTIGLVIDWSGGHAYNMFVYEDGSVELYEPQNDNFVEPGSADRFAFERVRVII